MSQHIVYAPTLIMIGAHVVRYAAGRVAVFSSPDKRSRAVAWDLLTDDERSQVVDQIGEDVVTEWLGVDVLQPSDVPEGLRAAEWDYSHVGQPRARPAFEALNKYAPPPRSISQLAW